ncbi:MAG: PD-(D/E)XK nuclease family protein [Acidobacteria bacterium]|nr:PD-(D/E)XK nuclease family protein [Acidobacteriota bacterium]
MNEHPVCERLGEVLSPSQVSTYLACPAKWYFRYLVGLSEPATGALALGKAFHATLAANFRQKMVLGCHMQPSEVRDVFAEEWKLASADVELREDEDASELASTGEALAIAYISEAACSVQPRAVEQAVAGEIAGIKVRGVVDVLDVEGCVVDFKTASKRPNGITAEHGLQLTTYAIIVPGASGVCRLDTVTKTKTVQVVQQTYEIGPEERRFAETLYPMVQDSIRDGLYPPHRNSPLCSRRHCGYWRECEREFGGRVPE